MQIVGIAKAKYWLERAKKELGVEVWKGMDDMFDRWEQGLDDPVILRAALMMVMHAADPELARYLSATAVASLAGGSWQQSCRQC